jgi:hypothetical protein
MKNPVSIEALFVLVMLIYVILFTHMIGIW